MPIAWGFNLWTLLFFVDEKDEGGETTDGWEDDDDMEPEVFLSAELSFYSTTIIDDADCW